MPLQPGARRPVRRPLRARRRQHGEVYRARDGRLGREVAVKVLPAGLSADAERLHRFEQEARAAAALNHPNIAQIHGLEESTGVLALVMELVEGPILADRMARGAAAGQEIRIVLNWFEGLTQRVPVKCDRRRDARRGPENRRT